MSKRHIFIYTLLLLLLRAIPLFGAGTVTGEFLLVNINARESALGGAYSANFARPGAAFVNPAALLGINYSHVFLTHYENVFGAKYDSALYARPLKDNAAIAATFTFSSNDTLYRTDEEGYPVEKIENYDAWLGGAYAWRITEDIHAGAALKITASRVLDRSEWGGAVSAGGLYINREQKFMIGLCAENLGITTAFFDDGAVYPIVLRAGYGTEVYRYLEEYRIFFFIEERISINENEGAQTSFGLEAVYRNFIVFRYGYVFGVDQEKVALGLGVKFSGFNIDYAYQPYFVSDNAHRFTLEIYF